jgi:hypothetical protein
MPTLEAGFPQAQAALAAARHSHDANLLIQR